MMIMMVSCHVIAVCVYEHAHVYMYMCMYTGIDIRIGMYRVHEHMCMCVGMGRLACRYARRGLIQPVVMDGLADYTALQASNYFRPAP